MNIALVTTVGILGLILCLSTVGLLIYSLIQFIQLSNLAIKALNIYIEKNDKNTS
ncbi:hypothetical protein N4T77_15845 [Clostridium sp. CX1]|uniref:Uncharacterized protein n=1 Tax=Clostridium tanneri TaxID=3037988 RepID=A0ABU4JRZ7_9CLOT|nr:MULTISPECIES: hypothetical protein [unclassified Clostridium]MCT8978063.1 hypothetical protein [Clostridium sp. CX1]MDW8800915.1 hypothetical protein [Clostridium sp. A1-XYC3]